MSLLSNGFKMSKRAGGVAIDKTGLVGWWDNDYGSGTVSTIADQHTSGNDLSTVGSPSGGRTAGTHPSGIGTQGTDFVPVDYGHSSSPDFDITSGGLTLGAWIYFDTLPTNRGGILSKYWGYTGGRQYVLYCDAYGDVGLNLSNNGLYQIENLIESSTQPITAAEWHFVVGQWDPGIRSEVFVNNSSVAVDTTSITSTLFNSSTHLKLGLQFSSVAENSTDGMIMSAFVFNRVLSSGELSAIYNSGAGVKYADL